MFIKRDTTFLESRSRQANYLVAAWLTRATTMSTLTSHSTDDCIIIIKKKKKNVQERADDVYDIYIYLDDAFCIDLRFF